MSPMFKTTGGADFPDKLKAMITGPPKSGKTTFLGTVPNIVIADTEPNANNLASVAHLNLPYVTIDSTDDLQALRFVLSDETLRAQAAASLGIPTIDAVAIDTLDSLQSLMKRERLRETRKSEFLRDDWGWLKLEMEKLIENFTSLPLHVFFIVHTKTKDVGKGENKDTIILPGLEGSISESIAGMVGYSMLAFRNEQIKPDGTKYTKYWLRAEGDNTYEFLGTRTAGRLPDIIEPDFKVLFDAAMAGRPTQQAAAPVAMPQIQTTGQTQGQPPAQQQAATQPATQPANPGAPQQEAAQTSGQPAAPGTNLPADTDPVNPAALQHMKRVYDAIGKAFPEELLKGITLGDARTLVRTWQAILTDDAEGKGKEGETKEQTMTQFLGDMGWLGEGAPATAPEEKTVEPKVDGTIDQVMAYVGDDLARVQEAYDLEAGKDSSRKGLVDKLIAKGAKDQTAVEKQDAAAPATEAEPPPATAEPAVTPAAPSADATSTEEQATALVADGLGGEVISDTGEAEKCEECGGAIDDPDIATLSQTRFRRKLCVTDYIAETKKPREAATA